ncbi:ethanolamine kinase [Nemania abortiva]|nr:ethanolamine kinase [Nemania abortiva]
MKLDAVFDRELQEPSALVLINAIRPEWKNAPGEIRIERLVGGIPNAMLKISKKAPGKTQVEIDQAAVLLRANGDEPKVLVNRDLEAYTHEMLAERNLAAPLFARFKNGLLYGYVPGRVCQVQDLAQEEVWGSVASKLGEFHARMPRDGPRGDRASTNAGISIPTIWAIMQNWVNELPSGTPEQEQRGQELQTELLWSFEKLKNIGSIGDQPYVYGHCDLLCGNIIITKEGQADQDGANSQERRITPVQVHFIDYEFAMLCPAAFDIANHFSEWGGFDCDYEKLPRRAIRKKFIDQYLASYVEHAGISLPNFQEAAEKLTADVDQYRGIPGLWWGIHGLVSVLSSKIEFDWIGYSNKRLAEYRGWKAKEEGFSLIGGEKATSREESWARE